jgi:hypothetical protein
MSYAGGGKASTTQSGAERADEARRLLAMGLEDIMDNMRVNERDFVMGMVGSLDAGVDPTPKQLWWLRDLKEKYL